MQKWWMQNSSFSILHSSLRCFPALAPAHDEFRRGLLLVTRLAPFHLAPRRYRRASARGLALAAAQRVIHRVHRDAAHPRPAAQPARLSRLAHRQQLVLGIADFADGGEALA